MTRQILPGITGVRFVAIFHIFLHHLWAVYYYLGNSSPDTMGLFSSFDNAPKGLLNILSNGWVSTSFFFMLSGFLLGFLYWQQNGSLRVSKRDFWIARFSRIYPIHLAVLVILILYKFDTHLADGYSLVWITTSAITTGLLLQAWIPPFIPMWSWPTWTISVLAFLYLITPSCISLLSRIEYRSQVYLFSFMPIVSMIPAMGYYMVQSDEGWNMNVELFFSNFPLFWVAYFAAGLLLSRIFIYRQAGEEHKSTIGFFSVGDIAFAVLILVACALDVLPTLKYFLRFGLLMPVYMILIYDLARGKGMLARIMSTRLLRQLGNLSFAIFIWQAVILALAFSSIKYFPGIAEFQVALAIVLVIIMSYVSTHYFEKPVSKWIKAKMNR